MSRSQDIFGVLRGIQLVLNSSVKTQEAYLKHLWSHSSIRDVLEKNCDQTQQCGKKFVENPTKELENIGSVLKETLERTSLVAEGVRKYAISERSSQNFSSSIDTQLGGDVKSIKNIENLDIASITLRELENLLAEHNKIRDVNLRQDIVAASKKKKTTTTTITEEVKKVDNEPVMKVQPPPKSPTNDVAKDEKQVENMISFISNYNQTGDQPAPEVKEFVPTEVSSLLMSPLMKEFLPFLYRAKCKEIKNFNEAQNRSSHEQS